MTHFVDLGERTKSPEELTLTEKVPLLLFGITVPRPENVQTPADYNLDFETIMISSDEGVLESWIIPADQNDAAGTVILFHGYAESKDSLLPEAEAFHKMGYTTLLVDFRGSGGSTGNQTSVGYYEAKDVANVYHFAKSKTEDFDSPIILYGMSMGGAALLRAVTSESIDPDALIIEAVFDQMISTVENRFQTMGLPAFPAAQFLVFWGGVQSGFNGFNHNPADYAADVKIPVLMLHGENDPRATLKQGQHLYSQFEKDLAQLVVFTEVKHESSLEVEPEKWENSTSSFLNQIKLPNQ